MGNLVAASLIWALSFGLIKHVLIAPGVSPYGVTGVRLALSWCLFAPWMSRHVPRTLVGRLIAVGAIQYGVMYLAYTPAFQFLDAHLVALFTVTTPLYVALIHDAMAKRLHPPTLMAAFLAVVGGAVVLGPGGHGGGVGWGVGATLVQVSNLAFALGQVGYRKTLSAYLTLRDEDVFGWVYTGAVLVVVGPALRWGQGNLGRVTLPQSFTLLYLGLIPSGVGFYLWNRGARRARVGTVAVMNNAKIPLSVLCSVLVFGERPRWLPLLVGGAMMGAAVVWAERSRARISSGTGATETRPERMG